MPATSPADAPEIVRRLRAGDETALAELQALHGADMAATARSILGVEADAEEVVMDVLARAWTHAHRFDARRGTVPAWLLTMTRSRSLSRLRRRRRRRDALVAAARGSATGLLLGPGAMGESADECDRRRWLQALLERLPESQREIVVRAYFDGFTQREIADALDAPLGTVKSRMRLALDKLRDWAGEGAAA